MSLASWIGNWLWGPSDSLDVMQMHDGSFVPSLADIHRAREILRYKVPTELANIILEMAEYYHIASLTMDQPRPICNTTTYRVDVPILSLSLHDPKYSNHRESIVKVSLVIKGHDQGWSGYPADKGTKNNSWTWYSIGTNDPQTHESRLATNSHAVKETQTHVFEWSRESEIVQILAEGETLEVWAHARFPGWVNHVEYAQLKVTCFPL